MELKEIYDEVFLEELLGKLLEEVIENKLSEEFQVKLRDTIFMRS